MAAVTPALAEVIRPVAQDARPLVVHVVHRFDTGGLENGVVNLIDRMPEHAYRHAVLALTQVTSFAQRLKRQDVGLMALHKPPGHGAQSWWRMRRWLLQINPAVVHTRNLGPLEMQVAAALAGVAVRVHGEHGRELNDLDGHNRKLQWVRRLYSPFVHHYIALSQDLAGYLTQRVGIRAGRVTQIYNGVDTAHFHPPPGVAPLPINGCPFDPTQHWLVGTVGRMQGVKHQTLLAQAFVQCVQQSPQARQRMRLLLVGDGPLRAECTRLLADAGLSGLAWLPGERADVADVMRGLSCFVLPSLAEGISNTILEAMASGLPVVATAVGGNAELIIDQQTGAVVPSNNPGLLAQAMLKLFADPATARSQGVLARATALQRYSLDAMVASYQQVYDRQLAAAKSRH